MQGMHARARLTGIYILSIYQTRTTYILSSTLLVEGGQHVRVHTRIVNLLINWQLGSFLLLLLLQDSGKIRANSTDICMLHACIWSQHKCMGFQRSTCTCTGTDMQHAMLASSTLVRSRSSYVSVFCTTDYKALLL